jgi:hypothetical protein
MKRTIGQTKGETGNRTALSKTDPMATNTLPTPGLKVEQVGFDLKSQGEVTLRKVGDFTPINDAGEFVNRLGGDSALILQLMNKALVIHTQEQLAGDPNVPWQLVEEDEETGVETLVPFDGSLIDGEKAKALKPTVIQIAKLIFGYAKNMVPGDKEANSVAKKAAKDKALASILNNPAMVEGLKSK